MAALPVFRQQPVEQKGFEILTLRLNKIIVLTLAIILGGALLFSTGEAAKAKKSKASKTSKRRQSVVYMPKPTGDIQDDLDKRRLHAGSPLRLEHV